MKSATGLLREAENISGIKQNALKYLPSTSKEFRDIYFFIQFISSCMT